MTSSTNQPSKKSLRNSGGGSEVDTTGSQSQGGRSIRFARRTSSGRYVNLSRDALKCLQMCQRII